MALIQCIECGHQVATTAAACPHCGAPPASQSQGIGTPLATIQQTSKRLKAHIVIATVLFWGGLISFSVVVWLTSKTLIDGATSISTGMSVSTMLSMLAVMAGFCIYTYTKLRIWWHHK